MVKRSSKKSAVSQSMTEAVVRHSSLRDLFGAPPLLKDEEIESYNSIHALISDTLRPTDAIEEIWLRDIVDLSWEIIRLRNLRAAFVEYKFKVQLKSDIKQASNRGDDYSNKLIAGLNSGDEKSQAEFTTLLKTQNRTLDDIKSNAFVSSINEFDRFDNLIARAEARRNSVIREIDRRRHALALILREASDRAIRDGSSVIEGKLAKA